MWLCLVGGRLESPVKVEAAKGISYCRPMLGAVNLLSKGVHTPATEEKDCNVMYSIDGFQKTFNVQCGSNL